MDDELGALHRTVLLAASLIAAAAVGVVMLEEARSGGVAAGVAIRAVVTTGFLVLAGLLAVRRVTATRAHAVGWFLGAVVAAVNLVGEATPATGAATYMLSWVSFVTILCVTPYVIIPHRPARRIAVAVVLGGVVCLGWAVQPVGLTVGDLAPTLLPVVVLVVADGLASTTRVVQRHERQARREADIGRYDQLTGLLNRRGVMPALTGLTPGSVLLLVDLDHFKQVNDQHGHAAGDDVLRGVATAIREAVRDRDEVARWGGEEYLVVGGPTTDAAGALELGRRVHGAVARSRSAVPVTASVGVAVMATDDADWQDVFRRADSSLYDAKRAGRDRVGSAAVPDR